MRTDDNCRPTVIYGRTVFLCLAGKVLRILKVFKVFKVFNVAIIYNFTPNYHIFVIANRRSKRGQRLLADYAVQGGGKARVSGIKTRIRFAG